MECDYEKSNEVLENNGEIRSASEVVFAGVQIVEDPADSLAVIREIAENEEGIEVTEYYIKIPVANKAKNAEIVTIDVADGIKALYDTKNKKIVTLLFDKESFNLKEAKEWIKKHEISSDKIIKDLANDVAESVKYLGEDAISGLIDNLTTIMSKKSKISTLAEYIVSFIKGEKKDEEASICTTKYINSLPDSAFAYIDEKYKSEESEDKNLRKLPYKNKEGNIDKASTIASMQELMCESACVDIPKSAHRMVYNKLVNAYQKLALTPPPYKEESSIINISESEMKKQKEKAAMKDIINGILAQLEEMYPGLSKKDLLELVFSGSYEAKEDLLQEEMEQTESLAEKAEDETKEVDADVTEETIEEEKVAEIKEDKEDEDKEDEGDENKKEEAEEKEEEEKEEQVEETKDEEESTEETEEEITEEEDKEEDKEKDKEEEEAETKTKLIEENLALKEKLAAIEAEKLHGNRLVELSSILEIKEDEFKDKEGFFLSELSEEDFNTMKLVRENEKLKVENESLKNKEESEEKVEKKEEKSEKVVNLGNLGGTDKLTSKDVAKTITSLFKR